MKRLYKNNKKGFTLVEMMLVIFIILVLATVLAINVSVFFDAANRSSATVAAKVSTLGLHARADDIQTRYGFSS